MKLHYLRNPRLLAIFIFGVMLFAVPMLRVPLIEAYGHSGPQSEYISGPSGTLIDGVYKDGFTMNFWYRADNVLCDAGPTREYVWNNTSAPSGRHLYDFYLLTQVGMIAYKIDGGSFQTFIPYSNTTECFTTQYSIKIHSTYITVDNSPPTVQFDANLNNLRTKDSIYYLTGTVSDDTDGGTHVSINGAPPIRYIATTSGTFNSSVYLDKVGAHTFTATATDVVGHVGTSSPITIYRDGDNTTTTSPKTTSSNSSQPNTTQQANQTNQNNTAKINSFTDTANFNQKGQGENLTNKVPLPVIVAGGAGILGATGLGIASFTGYVPYRKIGTLIAKFFGK